MAGDRRRGRAGGGARGRTRSLDWVLVVVGVALIATVVLALQRRASARRQDAAAPVPASASVPSGIMEDIRGIPADTWDRIGTAGAAKPTFVGDSLAVGSKPVVLYIGAGYCPYCAAARWSIITALSRFGTFSDLSLSASSTADVFPGTPTFSFYGGSYTSPNVEFQSVELAGETLMLNGRYPPLETPTEAQEALLRKYDAPPYVEKAAEGGIPFILVGGRYMWSGSPFTPSVLAGRTQADIAATLPGGTGPAAAAILANANELTATICDVTGNRPAEVCSDPMIQEAIEGLPREAP